MVEVLDAEGLLVPLGLDPKVRDAARRLHLVLKSKNKVFFHLIPKLCTYCYVPLMDVMARFFPNSYAATGNETRITSVAPLLRDLNPGRFID